MESYGGSSVGLVSSKISKSSLSFVTYQSHFTTIVTITQMDPLVRVRSYEPHLSEFPNLDLFLPPVLYGTEYGSEYGKENRTRYKASSDQNHSDYPSTRSSVSLDPADPALPLTLWVPQFNSQISELSGRSSSPQGLARPSLQDNPFVVPSTLRIAPVFLTRDGQILARFFSRRKLQVEFACLSYQSLENLAAQGRIYTVERGGPNQHPHCKLFCEQKLRFLLSPYGRKVFYANHREDLLFLPSVRAALGTEDLWLKLSESLRPANKEGLAGFIRQDFPKEKPLHLRVLRKMMADSQKITPYYG